MQDARYYLEKIVSGGQTGVDRAALDWAIASHIPHGGWCPFKILNVAGLRYSQESDVSHFVIKVLNHAILPEKNDELGTVYHYHSQSAKILSLDNVFLVSKDTLQLFVSFATIIILKIRSVRYT